MPTQKETFTSLASNVSFTRNQGKHNFKRNRVKKKKKNQGSGHLKLPSVFMMTTLRQMMDILFLKIATIPSGISMLFPKHDKKDCTNATLCAHLVSSVT